MKPEQNPQPARSICWHWPDHVIGKRESRRLREEHNRLANSHTELVTALENLTEKVRLTAQYGQTTGNFGTEYEAAKEAIAKAEKL